MSRAQRVLLVAVLFATMFSPVQAIAASAPAAVCSGGTCTVTFTHISDFYSWTVPTGVTTINFDVLGAQGGSGIGGGASGGLGGRVTGTLTTTPGATLFFYVGGRGAGGASSASSVGGFNGGGNGAYDTQYPASYSGGAGGGSSDIRTSSSGSAYTNRLIVAGGGGGGSGGCNGSGGAGGGTTGVSGTSCGSAVAGGGGSQSAGGTANTTRGSTAGSLGVGGTAGNRIAYGSGGGGGGFYGGGAGSSTQDHGSGWGGGGGGGSSYTHPTLASSVTHTQGSRSGDGSIVITYLGSPIPTTFSTSQSSPTSISTGSTISYSLVLSQSVTDLAVGDFQFGGTSSCNTPGLSGSGTTYTVTVTNCSEGTLILQLKANSITGASTGPPSVSSANTVVIDRTAPTISSVTGPANGTYKPSDTPTFTVGFSESVTITGTPRLVLTVGSATEYATFQSFTDSRTALFRYTVASDPIEFDTDGIAISTSLDLNSGTIRDLATNSLTNLTFSTPTLTSVLVAQPAAAPTIDSITATSGQLAIYFTPGAARGSTTTTYQYSSNGGAFINRPTGTTASPLILTGLTNGTGYTIRLRATTNAGAGDSSTAVTDTPTAIVVTGDATLVLTYGNSASTSAYSASGGTNTFTWTLGSSLTGITLSGTTVTASSSTPAGTYSQTVRATDGNSQVGSRALTITVNKASTSISIALPNGATNAALGGAITITATVPRAGSVNFMLGGSSISGCGSASASTTTATCSWTPSALGSVSLTATFTPTDSSNFETSTTTTLSITVVNGVSSVTLSLAGGTTTPQKSRAINIIAAIDQAGRVTFSVDGKRLLGCTNVLANAGNVTCSWKPAIQKDTLITARLVPTNNVYNSSNSSLNVRVVRRAGLR